MTYITIRRSKFHFEAVILSILLVAFLLAMLLMFVHPTGSLAVFFAGLLLAGVASVVVRIYGRAEKTAAAHELAEHHCPNCAAEVQRADGSEGDWHCDACGSDFMPSGIERV